MKGVPRCQIKGVQEVGRMIIKMNDIIVHRKCHVIFVYFCILMNEKQINMSVSLSDIPSGVFVTVRLNSETDLITRLIILAFRLLDILLIPFCKNRFTDFSLIKSSKIAH